MLEKNETYLLTKCARLNYFGTLARARGAGINSAHLASYAKVAAENCKSCEAECRKHPEHEVCKNCGETVS